MPDSLQAFTDSDWAGDKLTRKSTSGGVIMFGDHMLKSWSTTQQVIAMSSGEAELYALIKGASQIKGMMTQFKEWGTEVNGIIRTDASAALGMVHRQGLGKTRHIDVQYLWIQGEVMEEKLSVTKVATEENPADVLTKVLKPDIMKYHTEGMGFRHEDARASSALGLNEVRRVRSKEHQAACQPGATLPSGMQRGAALCQAFQRSGDR